MSEQRFSGDGKRGELVLAGALDAALDRVVPSGPASAFLVVVVGDAPGRIHALTRNTMIVGRADDAEIRLGDRSVSSEHARIINGPLGFEIEDLGSTNGTYVGGRRVLRARISHGDRVRVGNVELRFLRDRQDEPTIAVLPTGVNGGATPSPLTVDGEEEGPSLRQLIQRALTLYAMLRRHRTRIIAFVGAGALLGALSAVLVPSPQSASSEVKLHPQVKLNPVETGPRPSDNDAPQFFSGGQRAFTSPDLVRTTLMSLGDRNPDDASVGSIASRLKFENMGDNLYLASYKERLLAQGRPDPATFLNAHIDSYLKSEIDKGLKVFVGEADFLRSRLKDVDNEISKLTTDLVMFREAHADSLPDQVVSSQASRVAMETRRLELSSLITRLEGELASVRSQIVTGSPLAQAKAQSSSVYREKLITVKQRLGEARAKGLADGHPEIKVLLDEKARLEKLIDEELHSEASSFDKLSNAGLQTLTASAETLQAQLRAARNELGDLDKSLGRLRKMSNDLPKIDARLQDMTQKLEQNRALRAQLFDRLKKAEVQLELERVSVTSRYEVVSAPRLQAPGRIKTMATRLTMGLVLGLMLAACVILYHEGRRLVLESLPSADARPRFVGN